MNLDLHGIVEEYRDSELRNLLLQDQGEITLYVACGSIGSTQNNIDIAHDYLFTLYVGECLYDYCSDIKCTKIYDGVSFNLKVHDSVRVADELWRLSTMLSDEGYDNYGDVMGDFEDRIDSIVIHFPELADSYMANAIADSDFGYLHQAVEQHELDNYEHPEYFFGFWRSFISQVIGFDVYTSIWAWIVPRRQDGSLPDQSALCELLRSLGGYGVNVPDLITAHRLSISGLQQIVLSPTAVAKFPHSAFLAAQNCIKVIRNKNPDAKSVDEACQTAIENAIYNEGKSAITQTLMSEEGSILLVVDGMAEYIFFQGGDFILPDFYPLERTSASSYLSILEDTLLKHFHYSGNEVVTACPWENLDDEMFEELCYHVLYNSERFDSDNIDKMGKSRSRDGGRDIVAKTRKQYGKEATKWIFQCKLLTKSKSLGTRQVDIADTIDHYKPDGFAIMTNGLIDAGLHDRLEAIKENRKIEIEKWDRLRLERALAQARNRSIRMRYFNF